jgi:lysophospholipase L1-like esterase
MFTKKIIFYIFIVLINSFIFIGLEWLAGRSIFNKNIYRTVGLMEGLHPFMEYDKDLGYRIRRQAMEKPTATFEIKTSPYKSIPGKFNFTPSEGVIRSENGDIAINRLGFRGPNFKEKQGSNIFRIIALGGSTTAGMYQNQLTYPRLLERMLNQSQVNKRHFQVINAGMWGHNTCQVKTRFRNEIIDLNPNFIILMSGWNDINKIRSSDIKRRDQYCDNHYSILMKSNIFRWLRLKIGERIKKSDKELGYKVLEKNLKYYEQNIREVIEGAKSHKIKVIIVGLPGLYENRSLDEFKNYIQFSNMKPNEIEYRKKAFLSINKIKRKLAKEYSHVSYIDNGLSDNAIKKQDFFSDPVHPTGSGNRIMAYNIYESLIAQINNTSGNKDPNGNLAISKNKLELQYLKGLFASNRIEDLSSSGCIAVGKISCSAMHKTLTGPIYVTAAVEFALGSMLQFSSDIKTPELAEQIERILKIINKYRT